MIASVDERGLSASYREARADLQRFECCLFALLTMQSRSDD